jgi:hypothetical protein
MYSHAYLMADISLQIHSKTRYVASGWIKDSSNKLPTGGDRALQRCKRPPIIQRAKDDPLRRGANVVPSSMMVCLIDMLFSFTKKKWVDLCLGRISVFLQHKT